MIFAEDMLEAVLAGTKTQTRRRFKGGERRCRYIPGRDYAVQAKRGGFAVARILIVGVSAVPCFDISRADARAEGFPSPDAFHERWRLMHGSLSGWCWRIEFRLVTPA